MFILIDFFALTCREGLSSHLLCGFLMVLHLNTKIIRWTKLLHKAMRTGSKVVLIGDMVTCEGEPPQGNLQFRLTNQNALMISGQCSMSGDQACIFEYCCGGFIGWTRTMDILNEHEHLNMLSLGGVDRERAGCSCSPKED